MANVTSSDWTISLLPTGGSHMEQVWIKGKTRTSYVRFDLSATQGLAYPSSGGIPVPTFNATSNSGDTSYGMRRNINHMKMINAPAGGVNWQFIATDKAIRGYWGLYPTAAGGPTFLSELPTTLNVSEIDTNGISFTFEVEGW